MLKCPLFKQSFLFGWLALILIGGSGCVGMVAQLMHVIRGHKLSAECDALEGRKVAVVCVSGKSSYGPESVDAKLARSVHRELQRNVEDISLVSQDDVADWISRNDWNEVDFREVGRGLEVEYVVAIDVSSYSLYEGQTLYRGQADITTTVFDMNDKGREIFRKRSPDVRFPSNSGIHTTDITEADFEQQFIRVLANHTATSFYDHEFIDTVAPDRPSFRR